MCRQVWFQKSFVNVCFQWLFVSISNLFPGKFILIWAIIVLLEWCFGTLNKEILIFLWFILYSIFIFVFTFYICILFCGRIWHAHWILKCENSWSFLHFIHCVKSVQIRSFLWSASSYIQTEYRDLRSKSPNSVRIQEKTDQKKLRIWTLFTQW